jgi:hypothetical protein
MSEFRMFRGDDRVLTVTIIEEGGPLDLTGVLLRFTAKRKLTDADSDAVISKATGDGISHGMDPTLGIATVTLDAEDTEGEAPGPLRWDVQLTDGDGLVRTIATGRLVLLADASVTVP